MIVVTGGAGFIGSALVWGLNRRGRTDILVVDRLDGPGKSANLAGLRFADYMDKDEFLHLVQADRLPADIEAVLHMGARTATTEQDLALLVRDNLNYTKTIACWAADRNVRFIYASSAATYGDGSAGFEDDEGKLRLLSPLNPYAHSKHMFDLWALETGLLCRIVGLKYFNVFGPNEYHKADMRSFALKAYLQIKEQGKVRLFRSEDPRYPHGQYKRDFVYIKDVVDMTLFFLEDPCIHGIFNIGTGQAHTWNSMVEAVFWAMGLPPRIEYIEMPPSIGSQYQYFTQARMEKLLRAGYARRPTPLDLAIRQYVQGYLQRGAYLQTFDCEA